MSQVEPLSVHIKLPFGHLLDPLPVALLHGVVQHPLEERAELIEVVDLCLEVYEGLPLLEAWGQLTASAGDW